MTTEPPTVIAILPPDVIQWNRGGLSSARRNDWLSCCCLMMPWCLLRNKQSSSSIGCSLDKLWLPAVQYQQLPPHPPPPTRCSHLASIIFRLENNPLPPPENPPSLLRTAAAPASLLNVSVTVTLSVAGSHLSGASLVRALCQFHVGTDGSRGQMRRCDTNLSSCTNTILRKLINHYIHTLSVDSERTKWTVVYVGYCASGAGLLSFNLKSQQYGLAVV